MTGTPPWSTVALAPQRSPRFRAECVFCDRRAATTTSSIAVARVGERQARDAYVVAPARLDVPSCGACRWRRSRPLLLLCLLVLAPVPLAFGVGRLGSLGVPHFEVGGVVRSVVMLGWLGVVGALVWRATRSHFDVAFDGQQMLYSFRDQERAAAFAADHGTTIVAFRATSEEAVDAGDRGCGSDGGSGDDD